MPGFTGECLNGQHAACTDTQCRCSCHPWTAALVPAGQPNAISQKICPQCNTRMPLSENFCRKDGARLIQGIACKKCGSPMLGGDKFCWMCGAPKEFQNEPTQRASGEPSVEVQAAGS